MCSKDPLVALALSYILIHKMVILIYIKWLEFLSGRKIIIENRDIEIEIKYFVQLTHTCNKIIYNI